LAARALAAAAEDERIIATISIGLPALVVAGVTVEPGSELDGRTVAEVEASGQSRAI
jgi:hypothetical protein